MELRSTKLKEYKTSLTSIGLYEEGMKLEEMKQVLQAWEESQLECETSFFENDIERALKESELDYIQMHCDAHSSTMINQLGREHNANTVKTLIHCPDTPTHRFPNSDASPFSSPEITAEKLVIEAVVHHELNWSPPQKNCKIDTFLSHNYIKGCCNTVFIPEKRKVIENSDVILGVKRSRPPTTPSQKTLCSDSEGHWEYDIQDLDKSNEASHSDPSF